MDKIRFVLFLFWLSGCGNHSGSSPASVPPPEFRPDKVVAVTDGTNTVAVFQAETAADDYSWQTGLMYRKSMRNTDAMLFIFPDEQVRYFYMKNTYIPLDIIYIDKNKRIISIHADARPLDETPVPSPAPAQYVLEIKGGTAAAKGIRPGMYLSWTSK